MLYMLKVCNNKLSRIHAICGVIARSKKSTFPFHEHALCLQPPQTLVFSSLVDAASINKKKHDALIRDHYLKYVFRCENMTSLLSSFIVHNCCRRGQVGIRALPGGPQLSRSIYILDEGHLRSIVTPFPRP